MSEACVSSLPALLPFLVFPFTFGPVLGGCWPPKQKMNFPNQPMSGCGGSSEMVRATVFFHSGVVGLSMNSGESHRRRPGLFLSLGQRREPLTNWVQRCVPSQDAMQDSKRTWTRCGFPAFTAQIKQYGMLGPSKPAINEEFIQSLKNILVNSHSFSIHIFIEKVHNTEETAARIAFGLVLMEFFNPQD